MNPKDRFIRHRQTVEHRSHRLQFDRIDDPSSGFVFDCDPSGAVDTSKLNPAGLSNLNDCLAGNGVGPGRVCVTVNRYVEPAVIRCNCGAWLALQSSWANECDCGREYNGSAQLLAPRSQWGEETGEVFT